MSMRVMISLSVQTKGCYGVMLICAPMFEWACTNQTKAMLAMQSTT
jgi:hypothetical protein